MDIKALGKETIDDWFDFFDDRGFADHAEWNTCYCTAFFYPRLEAYPGESKKRRDYARWLIETGRMRGYMAYDRGKVVGWVNANDKKQFPRLAEICADDEKALSVVCFLIERAHRGKGIARALLGRIVEGAKVEGYDLVEAYPKKRASSEFGTWNGPYEMYIKAGFEDFRIGATSVVRKEVGKHDPRRLR
jgi:GNAT superfamily N-acetyltransferase